MKWFTVVSTASLLSSASAWSFTWRNAQGEASIETGHGPHPCITVNHQKGRLFELDGEGEKNINMLMFTTPDCSGDSAGSASEEFTKESSVAIRGFKVVALDATNTGSSTAASTTGTSGSGKSTSSPATASPSSGTTVTVSDEPTTAAATTTADATTTQTQAASTTDDAASSAATTESSENAAAALSAGGAAKVLAAVVLGFAGLA